MNYVLISSNIHGQNLENLQNSEQIKIFNVYKNNEISLFKRIFRKLIYFSSLKLNLAFYDERYKYLDSADYQFIIFDDSKPYFRLKRILKKAKRKPIIYFWNPVSSGLRVKLLKKDFLVYSYSKCDCDTYKIHYNHSFCVLPKSHEDIISVDNQFDTIFLGKDKNRAIILNKYLHLFKNPLIWIVKDKTSCKHMSISYKNNFLSYNEYLGFVSKSKSILDIVTDQHYGDTIRVAEAILLDKKLISNKKDLKHEFFYNSNMILILDDNLNEIDIKNFLESDSVKYSAENKEYFSLSAWLKRFKEK